MLSYWFLTGALLGNVQNVHCRSTVLRIIPLEILLCKYLEYCLLQYLLQNDTMNASYFLFSLNISTIAKHGGKDSYSQ